jgi:hypothetical protein
MTAPDNTVPVNAINDFIGGYKRSWDKECGGWAKRADAADFAAFLAAELGINTKGVVLERDGKITRLRIPLISQYWDPKPGEWVNEILVLRKEVKRWATS